MKYTLEEIKNRLSNIGEAIGTIALEYIVDLEKENEQLQQKWLESEYEKSKLVSQIEKMKRCENCKHSYHDRYHTLQCRSNCINFDKWEIAE
jgi:hypothetical protein